MGTLTLFLIAVGLSMDAFAVSITNGICYQENKRSLALRTGLTFGVFQAGMPLIGYFAGKAVSGVVTAIDHWIALVLLSGIGAMMIREAVKERREAKASCAEQGAENEVPHEGCKTVCSARSLAVQGIATSIDAFAVGISLAVMHTNIVIAVCLIGVVTFSFCVVGVLIGKRFGALLKEKAHIFGGAILILIGMKIFMEHV